MCGEPRLCRKIHHYPSGFFVETLFTNWGIGYEMNRSSLASTVIPLWATVLISPGAQALHRHRVFSISSETASNTNCATHGGGHDASGHHADDDHRDSNTSESLRTWTVPVRDLLRGCFALPAVSSLPGLRRQTFYIDPIAHPTFFIKQAHISGSEYIGPASSERAGQIIRDVATIAPESQQWPTASPRSRRDLRALRCFASLRSRPVDYRDKLLNADLGIGFGCLPFAGLLEQLHLPRRQFPSA